jgi:hypothetical protein
MMSFSLKGHSDAMTSKRGNVLQAPFHYRKAYRAIVDGIVSGSSRSKALQARGSAAGLRAMEADLSDFSNTNCPLMQLGIASLESSMALPGCFRATCAEDSGELVRLLREI